MRFDVPKLARLATTAGGRAAVPVVAVAALVASIDASAGAIAPPAPLTVSPRMHVFVTTPSAPAGADPTALERQRVETAVGVVRSVLRRSFVARSITSEYRVEQYVDVDVARRPFATARYAMATADGELRIDALDSGSTWFIGDAYGLAIETGARRARWLHEPSDPHEDVSRLFHGIEGVSPFGGIRRLAEELDLATVEAVILDGDLLTVRYRIDALDEAQRVSYEASGPAPWPGQARHDIVVDVRAGRLVGLTRYLPKPDDPDCAKAIGRTGGHAIVMTVERWEEFDGTDLPTRVRRHVWNRRGSSEQIFERTSVEPLREADRAAVMTTVGDGWSIVDADLGLEFVIGGTTLRWRGVVWRLAEPIHEHPGDRLAEMIERASVESGGHLLMR